VLRLRDRWVWDSWVADDGERYHLFFLQAPRSLGDPARRDTAATIGHAVSTDLVDWDYRATALSPASSGWDDLALWTGSVARGDDGVWRLYYTALSRRGRGTRDQRIGLAESADLETWRRVGDRPLLEVDPRWYATLPEDVRASETWRDPFVFRDPAGDGWHMLICARAAGAPCLRDGVLGHARSPDMRTWEVGPPACAPAGFGQLEVPQARIVDARPLLVFTCHPGEQSPEQRRRSGACCTWAVAGDALAGPWDLRRARPYRAEPTLFAAPLVRERDGGWALLGFLNPEPAADPALEIVDPIRVRLTADGELEARR
jgi:beta-fructofuranosidase